MATRRFSHLDDFVLKDDGNVGIGTSLPSVKLEVVGTLKAANLKATGVTTTTSQQGFIHQDMEYLDNVTISDGDSGTLSGEIVVGSGLTMTVGTGATTGQGIIESFKVSNIFTPPIGGTVDRPTAPQPGALFYNKDFKTIEYWDGHFWRQVDYTTQSGRGIFGGGQPAMGAGNDDAIQYIQIQSKGNSQWFGDLAVTGHGAANVSCCSSAIRGLFMGGSNPNSNYMNVIEYITMASAGDGADFGDLTTRVSYTGSCSSSTRGVNMGGFVGTPASPTFTSNTLSYVEIATLGNAKDFGDLQQRSYSPAAGSNGTRGIFAGGYWSGIGNLKGIESFTIASTGNAKDFGDLSAIRWGPSGSSNRTRMVVAGGRSPENGAYALNSIEFITMASEGNGVDFGNMSTDKNRGCSVADQTRCVFATGDEHPGPAATNIIEFIQIASGGTTEDFGDTMNAAQYAMGSCSDSHGGLGGF